MSAPATRASPRSAARRPLRFQPALRAPHPRSRSVPIPMRSRQLRDTPLPGTLPARGYPMADITIYIGNKNYSSWSLRAWLMLKQTGAAFESEVIPLYVSGSKATILAHSPSGKVPALRHGDVTVWDSLAIGEYLAETFPKAGLWPSAPAARARARSVSAEMHAGFANLRRHLPMNLRRKPTPRPLTDEVKADVTR